MIEQYASSIRSAEGWRMPMAARGVRDIKPKSNRFSARETMVTPSDHLLPMESGLEAKVAVVSLARPDVRDVVEQAATVEFKHEDGSPGKHTFDLVEEMNDNSKVAMMVKPGSTADKRGSRDLLRTLAAQTPATVATRFVLATDRDISPVQVTNARLIHAVRNLGPSADDPAVRAIAAHVRGPMTIGEAVRQSGTGAQGFRAAVRLVADGRLSVLSRGRMDRRTLIGPSDAEGGRS